MKLYGIPNCNTVKKARIWLDENNVPYTFHDFKKLGLTQTKANAWLAQQPWEKLVNRAGMTWRNLCDETKASITNSSSACALMIEKTSVIKRPILEKDDVILCIGFHEDTYKEIVQ
ncbi:MAG: ArsC family reductase [Methylophilaceae bacterium]|jgi:Spx/MgsR family transcriptional regulator|nr:MAG: ArsC family reductase [Methylophilaceae bacterium]